MLDSLMKRIQLMIGRCILAATNDSEGIQKIQITVFDEAMDKVQRFQNYGLSSHVPKGGKGIHLAVGSSRDDTVVVSLDHPDYRPKNLEEGEVVLYNKDGLRIFLKATGEISYTAENGHEFEGKKFSSVVDEGTSFTTNTFKVENETAELITTIKDLIETLESASVLTLLGNQPIIPVMELFPDLKLKVESFIEE